MVAALKDLAEIVQLAGSQHVGRVLQHLDVGQIYFKVLRRGLRTERFSGDVTNRTRAVGSVISRIVVARQWLRFQVGSGAVVLVKVMVMMMRVMVTAGSRGARRGQRDTAAVVEVLRAEETSSTMRGPRLVGNRCMMMMGIVSVNGTRQQRLVGGGGVGCGRGSWAAMHAG